MGRPIRQGAWQERARTVAAGIRRRVLEHTVRQGGGYLSQACSSAEILAALYLKVMRLGPVASPILPPAFQGVPGKDNPGYITGGCFNGPKGPDLDRFILSPSQYSLVLYAALVELRRMAPEGLLQFNQDGSTVEMIGAEHSPGMEVMTGSLGQGISQAAGIAMARKLKGESGKVWVFMSDGEFQIGQTWEALEAAAFHRLGNMGIYVDVNRHQCDGRTETVMGIEPLDERLRSFGARVFDVDGHDVEALVRPARSGTSGRPLVVLCRTSPWRGISILRERAPKFHYIRFSDAKERERYERALARLSGERG